MVTPTHSIRASTTERSQNLPLINQRYKPLITMAVTATGLAVTAVLAPWESIKITVIQLAPYLAMSTVITLLVSHVKSRNSQKEMIKNPYGKYLGVPLALQPGWEACHIRNTTGYSSIGVGRALLSVAIIAARAGLFIF